MSAFDLPRRLPIYGESVIDAARRTVFDDTSFTSWLFDPKPNGAWLNSRADEIVDLLCFLDAWGDPVGLSARELRALLVTPDNEDGTLLERPIHASDPHIELVDDAFAEFAARKLAGLGYAIRDGRIPHHACTYDFATIKAPTTAGVYFVRSGGRVKIGKADNIKDRLVHIRTSSPYPIQLIAIEDGGHAVERRLHARFKAFRVHGEWFELAPILAEYISTLSLIRRAHVAAAGNATLTYAIELAGIVAKAAGAGALAQGGIS